MKRFLGIEIGGSKLQIISGDEHGQIEHRRRFVVDRQAGASGILDHIGETLAEWKDLDIAGVIVGFGGPVNVQANAIGTSYHIKGWSEIDLASWITKIAGVPVLLENDANVAGLGEAVHGAGKGAGVVFYVTLGSGTGGGLVVNRKLYHGATMGEAEFGHLRLDKFGRTVESSCSGWAVNAKIRSAVAANPGGMLGGLLANHHDAESKVLARALAANDSEAWDIFNDTIDDLVFGLSHVTHLFHPDRIVLGGGLSLMGDILTQTVQPKLTKMIMDVFQPGPLVALSTLKEDAVPVGCLTLAAEKFSTVK